MRIRSLYKLLLINLNIPLTPLYFVYSDEDGAVTVVIKVLYRLNMDGASFNKQLDRKIQDTPGF